MKKHTTYPTRMHRYGRIVTKIATGRMRALKTILGMLLAFLRGCCEEPITNMGVRTYHKAPNNDFASTKYNKNSRRYQGARGYQRHSLVTKPYSARCLPVASVRKSLRPQTTLLATVIICYRWSYVELLRGTKVLLSDIGNSG